MAYSLTWWVRPVLQYLLPECAVLAAFCQNADEEHSVALTLVPRPGNPSGRGGEEVWG